ncbi:DNA cytosine methyltransferase, partial [Gammaproteobacteria bacterium]|nr:DNA cytosine methyltransferase [Gammaproteobacteria bacterium]
VCANKKFFKSNPFDFGKIRKSERKKLFEVIDRTKKQPDDYYLSMESKYYKMIEDVAKKNCKERLFQIRRVEARACRKEFCPTLTASMGEGGHNVPFLYDEFGLRRLTEDECFRLQGFDTGSLIFTDEIKRTDKLKMAGNAISVETVRNIISNIVDQLLSTDEEGGENERSETTMALSI